MMAERREEGAEVRSLGPKKGSYSVVWNYFSFEECDVDQVRVLCKLCSCSVQTSQGNTTNLINHLKSHHKVHYQEFQRLKAQTATTKNSQPSTTQTTISGTLFNAIPYLPSSQRPGNNRGDHVPYSQGYVSNKHCEHLEYFAATTDLRSSRTAEPYLSLTVHFIDSELEMKSKLLQTSFFPQDHTAEFIAAGLKEAMSAWGLNAMKDPRIDRAVGLCKKLVSSFSYSWKRKREFLAAQKEMKLPEHSLKTECPTRWGSRQAMIERIIEQQKAIAHVLSSDKKSLHLIPTRQDMDVLEAINKSLHPLVNFTDALSGEKYVSVSFVKPVLHLFNASILKVKDDDTDLSRAIKSKILEYLNEKYSDPDIQALLDMASTVSPQETAQETSEEDAEAGCAPKKKMTLRSYFKTAEQALPPNNQESSVACELQSYLQSSYLDSEGDPLKWWKEHEKIYPRLSKVAKKYLCIPATSSPSERAFSSGGNVVTCLRSSLKPDQVDRLMQCCQINGQATIPNPSVSVSRLSTTNHEHNTTQSSSGGARVQ
ncbi:E3 SUMO-protein ligase ZBED1 [Labeo rohita]|uniref:E3 SUMO-protein ligase ZBED1 n=1 Tax=Labeo rohita TaxID=84645 RepID=A0ABQ8L732_LABRO|nr:E3 SUMO-protein ligase ZBED1 [Labeo rohita]